MLIHPWDAALDPAEWQGWLATTDRFGMLALNNLDPTQAPVVLPTHFTLAGDELLVHLATTPTPHVLAGQGGWARRGRRADQLLHRGCSSCAGPRWSTTPRARRRSSPPSSPTSNPKAATQ